MKAKFYPLRALFFTLLLSFGFAENIKAQALLLEVRDNTTGGDGTQAYFGDELTYTITVTGPMTMVNPKLASPLPPGTSYVPQSTTLNGVPFADLYPGEKPWAIANLIQVPLPPTNKVEIKFKVIVSANSGFIISNAELQTVNLPTASDQKTTRVLVSYDCLNKFYATTTQYPLGYIPISPSTYCPYRYIKELDITTGSTGTSAIYDGQYGTCMNAYTQDYLPNGSVLTDATAMALQNTTYRLFFVNKPVNNVPADLCYFTSGTGYRFVNTPLTQNITIPITRMVMDAIGNGYAINDNGSEFIHFTVGLSNNVTIDPPVPLSNYMGNVPNNDVYAETGGDLVCDGTGNLLMITNSGKIYHINTLTKEAKYLNTIPNFPALGCNSVAIDKDGVIYIGGKYIEVYKLTLSTLTLTPITNARAYASTDFAGCAVPIQPARVAVNEKETRTTAPLSSEVSARVLPNPFRKELNLQVQLTTAEDVKVRLIDFYGRTVYTTTQQLGAGSNSLRLAVPANLGSGIYVVDVWAGNNRILQKKIVKQ